MPYTAYNTLIFADYAVNTVCNRLVDALITQFNEEDALSEFLLSGCASRKMQSPTDDPRVVVVNFITSSQKFYRYLAQNMGSILTGSTSIAYTDRIQIEVQGFKIEIWQKIGTILEPVDYRGIKIETIEWISNGDPCTYEGNPVAEPVPITMAAVRKFGIGGNELYQQQFTFLPKNLEIEWLQGDDVPDDKTVNMTIKNYDTDPAFDRYANFRLNILNGLDVDTSFTNFVSGEINGETVYDLADGLKPDLDIEFINFRFLEPGNYSTNIAFQVIADDIISNINGALLEFYVFEIDLKVIGSQDEYVDPRAMTFYHNEGANNFITLPLYVNLPGTYTLKYDKSITMTATGITDQSTTEFSIKRATGPKTFQVGLNAGVQNFQTGLTNRTIAIEHAGAIIQVHVSIIVIGEGGITFESKPLRFEAVQGVSEAEPILFSFISSTQYTIAKPSWLTLDVSVDGAILGRASVAPSSNFAPGTYEGEIVITNSSSSKTVPVSYVIKSNSFTSLKENEINFTGEQQGVNLSTTLKNVYLRIVFRVVWYDQYGTRFDQSIAFDEPIFKGSASFYPGPKVAAMVKGISDIDLFIPVDLAAKVEKPFTYPRHANNRVIMYQRDYDSGAIKKEDRLENLLFIKGNRPVNFYNNTGVTFSQHPIRVTKQSYGILNFIKSSGIHSIEIILNGEKLRNIEHDTFQDSSFGMIMSFKDFKEGDLVFARITDGIGGFFERKFYVFPENKESYHIAWVTEHEQLELFEFTGALSFETDFERVESTRFKNLVNTLEILKTERTQKLTANTGWILKDNHHLIDSLLGAKLAWLFLPDTDYKIPLVPQSKKMSNYDSDRTAYAFNVEFKINPENDGKVYPR